MTFPNGNRLLFLLVLLFASAQTYGQTSSSSPYSRYGIGDVQTVGTMQLLGCGGIGLALNGNSSLNLSNPASLGRISLTAVESGIKGNFIELRNEAANRKNNNINLAYFMMSFPVVSKKAGFSFGIVPLSSVGYSVKDPQVNSLGLSEVHTYEGSGGLHQFFTAFGVSLTKNLTAGANASVLFGNIIQDRRIEFSDPSLLNTRYTDTRGHNGFKFDFGLQYTFDSLRISPADSLSDIRHKLEVLADSLKRMAGSEGYQSQTSAVSAEMQRLRSVARTVASRRKRGDWNLTLGLTVSPEASISSKRTLIGETFRYLNASSRDQLIVKDTVFYSADEKGDVTLPLGFGAGVALRKGTRWMFGTDMRIQQWSGYRSFGQTDSLADSWRWSTGCQFIPDDRGFNSYWKQLNYMAGFHYAQTFLQLNGMQLNEIGVSAGLGLPIRRGVSTLRLMAEAGKRGTVESGLLEERYVRFVVNFTLNDRWFIKQRYD